MTLNKVFIATSLDGFIADESGQIDWLDTFPEINEIDTGYHRFMTEVDALLMGRNTYEKVLSFDIPWPYDKPVFVLSKSLKEVRSELSNRVQLVSGPLREVLSSIENLGHKRLYIDGGQTIQSLLAEDLIDEMIITTIPVLLGRGIPLFKSLPERLTFECHESKTFLSKVVQAKFLRQRN